MKNISFHVNYDNEVYTYQSGTESMISYYGALNNMDRKYGLRGLKEYVALVYDLYIKDSNDTPLGRLCDYVARHWKKLKNKGKYDILEEFYFNL